MTTEEQLQALLDIEPTLDAKAKELSVKHGVKVTPFVFIVEGENIIGYLKDPSRMIKMQAIDIREQSKTQAGDLILRSALIQEESDKRILEEKPENDAIYLGAIDFAVNTVSIYREILKKN